MTTSLLAATASLVALAGDITAQRQIELENLLQQDCGSCHGMTLKGGLGSPLTAEALAGKPPEYLFATIRSGLPGKPMPPWSTLLNDEEIHWLVNRLVGGVESP